MKVLKKIFLVFAFLMTLYINITDVYAQTPGRCGPAMGKILYSLCSVIPCIYFGYITVWDTYIFLTIIPIFAYIL